MFIIKVENNYIYNINFKMRLLIKLSILAMMMISITAQDSDKDDKDTATKAEDTTIDKASDTTVETSDIKQEDAKADNLVDLLGEPALAVALKDYKFEDGTLGALKIANYFFKAENSSVLDDQKNLNITGLSVTSEDGTVRTFNISGDASKSDNVTIKTIIIAGKAINHKHVERGLINITENATQVNDSTHKTYKISGKVTKTDVVDLKPVNGSTKVINFSLDGSSVTNGALDTIDGLPNQMAFVLNVLCKQVKKLAGVEYEQVTGKVNLDTLTLNLYSNDLTASFKLGTVAASLLQTAGYNNTQPLVIFMHGFIDDPKLFNFPAINQAFHKHGYFNILALDASPLIRYLYLRSSTYVRLIGEKLGATLAIMVKAGLDPKHIHLIGHSLGAHIAGFAGKSFQKETGSQVGRITGLDPAGPCFSYVNESLRLKASDAAFVDVVHTDAGVYGLTDPVGHVDFYVNGGKAQPDCYLQTCSHNRVVELFAAAIDHPELFPARACKDWKQFNKGKCSNNFSLMGLGCKSDSRGVYYLRTSGKKPYGLGIDGTRPKRIMDWVSEDKRA